MKEYIIYHDKPIFRNNYNQELGVRFRNNTGISFTYCSNNKQWIAFKGGEEIGLLNDEGIKFAESCCNPEYIKDMKK